VIPAGTAPVFNIETRRTHTFIANGVLVHNCNFMAKVEKSKISEDGGGYDQAMAIYNAIVRRRKSRFMSQGRLPGLLCVVSSKVRPNDFTGKKEKEARSDPTIFIYDKRIWEIAPWKFTPQRFHVFVGDQSRKPRILDFDEMIEPEDRHLVLEVPEEYRSEFDRDMLTALRDVGGVATQALHPFILAVDKIDEAFGRTLSILSREDCDFVSTSLQIYPKRFVKPHEPRFVHFDLSLSNDSTGMAMGYVDHFVEIQRDENWWETLPVIHYDLLLEIKPPRNGEIEFHKARSLLYRLREMGLNVKWVTFDTYQSVDSIQILRQQGFTTGFTSMDTETLPYETLKTAILDGRIGAPEHARAQMELTRLEFDPDIGKVDHPVDASKDVADSMAGVCFGLTMRRELWMRHKVPMLKIPQSLTKRQGKIEESETKSVQRVQVF
jgi:hypothetical protein